MYDINWIRRADYERANALWALSGRKAVARLRNYLASEVSSNIEKLPVHLRPLLEDVDPYNVDPPCTWKEAADFVCWAASQQESGNGFSEEISDLLYKATTWWPEAGDAITLDEGET